MKENTILMGYRGGQFLEAGAVFAPYVPLIMTPLVYEPDTFTPRKGLLTRYAKKVVRPEFYGKIFVSGLNTANFLGGTLLFSINFKFAKFSIILATFNLSDISLLFSLPCLII